MTISPLDYWIRAKTGATDAESLRAYQLAKLRSTLENVKKNSRFYREQLADIDVDRIKSIDDISIIPFTTAQMLAKSPLDFVCVAPDDIERIVTLPTSGTTGPSKRIFFTKKDQELTIDFFHRGMSTLIGAGDRVMIFLPCRAEGSVGDLLMSGLERLGCEGTNYGPVEDYQDAVEALSSGGCNCAAGLPAQLFALSRLGKSLKLKSVLLCSDYVSKAAVNAIESAWGCKAFCHYGMTESGLGGGVECTAHAGYHMREADLLFEVIDPGSGEAVRDGERGELVFTTLTRKGMPLIRYRTDDISVVTMEPCPCGSMLRRFDRVFGRISDIIEMPGGFSISMPMLDELLFEVPGLAGFSAEITPGAGDCILVITVFAPNAPGVTDKAQERLRGDRCLGEMLSAGSLELQMQQGGPEVLTYGNTKRRIIRAACGREGTGNREVY